MESELDVADRWTSGWTTLLVLSSAVACTAPNERAVGSGNDELSRRDGGVASMTGGGGQGAVDAPVGFDGGAPPSVKLGGTCVDDGGCGSGHCVGNVCCATACEKSAEGSCGLDGKCDSTGQCEKYGKETICLAESCAATTSTYTPPSVCDGKGACVAPAMTGSCAGAPCEGTRCQMGCSATKPCVAGNYCKDGTCAAQLSSGQCQTAGECMSGNCVDGVCCDKPCTDKCFSCRSGSCQPLADGEMATDDCPVGSPASCGNNGACNGAGACKRYGGETKCADGGCSGNNLLSDGRCDGNGACKKPSKSCQFGCSGSACNACAKNNGDSCGTECRPGKRNCQGDCDQSPRESGSCKGNCNNVCEGGECVPKCGFAEVCGKVRCGLAPKDPCTLGSSDCANGTCKRTGQCQCSISKAKCDLISGPACDPAEGACDCDGVEDICP